MKGGEGDSHFLAALAPSTFKIQKYYTLPKYLVWSFPEFPDAAGPEWTLARMMARSRGDTGSLVAEAVKVPEVLPNHML